MQISPVGDTNLYSMDYGTFSPVFEDPSPEPHIEYDPGSSPIGPLTPFGDFIDRAIAGNLESSNTMGQVDLMYHSAQVYDSYQDLRYSPSYSHMINLPQKQPSVPDTTSAQSASVDYKKLVEPLSEWLACYIWTVCTTGAGLPHPFFRPS
jgi:hypothetical protein